MTSVRSQAARGVISRRMRSIIVVTALLTTSFFALAMSQTVNEPKATNPGGPEVSILSPYAILEPSTKNNPNDKDGFPPSKSEADPEEAFLLGKIVLDSTIYDPTANLFNYKGSDGILDLTIDNDKPRDLDSLDGAKDGKLVAGTYYVYWNLNKTGYVPVNTTPGSPYTGSNSASISVVDDIDDFQLNLTYKTSADGTAQTMSSALYSVQMWKSASINQNDLNWLDTEPKLVVSDPGVSFTIRSKYRQSSAQGIENMILQSYYNGRCLRMENSSLYYYDDKDPGNITPGVPVSWTKAWFNRQQFGSTELSGSDNNDYWVTEYTFRVRTRCFSEIIPYIQTKKGGDTWKIDTGYAYFKSKVPGGVNPAILNITKYFSTKYPGGVVSGPDPPVVGQTTVFAINITVGNSGGDNATNVVVTDKAQLSNVTWLNIYTVSQGSLSFNPTTGMITWTVGKLVPNATATLSYRVSVTPTPGMVGKKVMLNSGASATGKSETSGNTTSAGPTPPLYTKPVIGVPNMTITKTASQSTADPDDQITYTLHYANIGSSTAYDVVVKDTIPDYVSYVSSDPIVDGSSGKVFWWDIGDVLAGGSGDVEITVQVNEGTPDGTLLVNVGRVEYKDYCGTPQPPKQAWANVTVTAPVMDFNKDVDVTTADPGDYITYTLTYKNKGTGVATDVVIVDTLPEHVTLISSTPTPASISGRVLTYKFDTVDGGASGTITIKVQVDAYTADGTQLLNTATLNYDDANGNPYPELTDSATTTVTAPVVEFDKAVDVAYADPGDIITYTIVIYNNGTGTATGVTLKDAIPEHTTLYSAVPGYDSVNGRAYTWNIGTLSTGGSKTITIKVKVDAYTADTTVLTNTATVDYADANGNGYPQLSDTATTTVTAPVMHLSKVADKQYANPGDSITYTITYSNSGTGYATLVKAKDTIPEHTTFVSCSPGYNGFDGDRTYTWNIGDVGPGGGGTITITVKVDAGTPDKTLLVNVVILDYADANGNFYLPQLSASASTTVKAPAMTIEKTADVLTADPGDIITYTLHYKNDGSGDATEVVIKDTIPAYTSFFDAVPWYDGVSGSTYRWDVGTVQSGEEGDIILKVKVDVGTADKTVLLNTVTLDYKDANGNPLPQVSDDATVTVTAPAMTFSKEVDVKYADPGDNIVYTLTYHNGGTGWASDVVVKDTIPDHVSYVSSSPGYSSVSGKTYTWNVDDVAPDGGGTITLTVKVDVGTADQTVLTNTATLDYSDANGNPYPQITSSACTTVTAPVFTFEKSADVASADPGDEIEYTLYYKNTGSGVATNVVVKDTIPLHVTFKSSTPGYSSVSGRTYTWNLDTINPGVSGYIYITVEVDVPTPDQTVLKNCATLDYADANGNGYPQKTDDATTLVTAPVMSIKKSSNVEYANPGDTVTYTLTYKNTGTGWASLVKIVDTLPSYMDYVDATPSPDSVSGNVLTWNIGDVAPSTTASITIHATVKVGTPDGTVLHNVVTLDYADANGNYYPQTSDCYDITVTAPVMSFTKSASVAKADPGDTITFTLHYANDGSGKATDVVVVDTLPDHVTFVAATPDPDSISGKVLTWNIEVVDAHSSGDITVEVKVDAYTADGTLLQNSATLDYDDANGNPYPQLSDDAQVTVTAPVMHVEKVSNVKKADPGDYITYVIYYWNSGSGEATGVVIQDTIPEHTSYVSSFPEYDTKDGRTYTWNIESVAGNSAKAYITLVVQVDVGTADATLLHNVVTLDYDDANGNPYPQLTACADVTVTAPVVSLTKGADVATADPGDQITYTVKFTNSGSGNATDVYLNDTIPEHVTFVSCDPAYLSVNGRKYTWHWDLVGPGASVTVTITVKVDAYTADKTLLHNVATTDYDDDNGNPYPRLTAYADVSVTAPVFMFSKESDVDKADPGDIIVYTLKWQNTGTGWASGVVIKDTIPDHVSFVSSSPSADSVSGKTYTWDLKDVAPGASGQITITVEVDAYTDDQTILHNTATLDYSDANGNPYQQLYRYADVVVTAPVMSFAKSADVTTADPGDTITYTLTYKNTGTGRATYVFITDTLPDHVTFMSATPKETSYVGNKLTWDIGNFGPGSIGTITIVVKVDAYTADQTVLHNTATLDYKDANGNPYPQIDRYWDVRVTAPNMVLSKSVDVATADPGDIITYTVHYENIGTGTAWNVVLVDVLPDYVDLISASPPPTSQVGNTLKWLIEEVAGSTSVDITIKVKVQLYTPDKTLLLNEVTLDYTDANGNPYPQLQARVCVTVTAPEMHIEKSAPATVTPGETFVYQIVWSNTGTGTAKNVVLTDVLPLAVTYVSATPSPDSIDGKTLRWNIGTVGGGGGGAISITVKVVWPLDDGTVLVNKATLYYEDANNNPYPTIESQTSTLVLASKIGDYVWNDDNMNGLQDDGPSAGMGGVKITLTGTTAYGEPAYLMVYTDSTGHYYFSGLPPGNYDVTVTVPAGWAATTPETVSVALGIHETYLDADFGLVKPYVDKTVSPDIGVYGNILRVTIVVKSPYDTATLVDVLPPELVYTGDAVDNDLDGFIDEERKNGADDDGDSLIDEDIGWFTMDGAYITGGLTLVGNELRCELPGRGTFTVAFDIKIIGLPEDEEITVINIARLVVGGKTIVEDQFPVTIRFWGFEKYFLPVGQVTDPDCGKSMDVVVDGGCPGYFWDYGDGDGKIETGELIVWLVQYNITNHLKYTWTNTRMWDRWGGEYGVGGDNNDNDHDGRVDEETLNGKDDDGDGFIDEDISQYWATQGSLTITLTGTPPDSDKVHMFWDVGTLKPNETALLTLPVFTDRNPGDNPEFPQGHQEFTSPGHYIMNSGGVVKWLDAQGHQHSAHTQRLYVDVTEQIKNEPIIDVIQVSPPPVTQTIVSDRTADTYEVSLPVQTESTQPEVWQPETKTPIDTAVQVTEPTVPAPIVETPKDTGTKATESVAQPLAAKELHAASTASSSVMVDASSLLAAILLMLACFFAAGTRATKGRRQG